MPLKKENPLVRIAKQLKKETDQFALAYDCSADKDAFMANLGDVISLRQKKCRDVCKYDLSFGNHSKGRRGGSGTYTNVPLKSKWHQPNCSQSNDRCTCFVSHSHIH